MKHIIAFFMICVPMLIMAQANTIDIGIFNVPANSNTFQVRIKPIQNLSGGYSAGVFTVRYPSSYGVTLSTVSSPYGYFIQTTDTQNGFSYYSFVMANFFSVNWNANQEYVIATLQHSNTGSGYGNFEIVNDTWTATHLGDYYQELNGSDAQRTFYGGPASAPLPVDLVSFTAKGNPDHTVSLDWRTYAENGIKQYFVEYSTDRLNFNLIGNRDAKGGLNTYSDYNFIDYNPVNGENYYRLKIVNFEGTYEYSPVRVVVFEDKDSKMRMQPNPTIGPFNLIYTTDKNEDITISINDINGRLVKETSVLASKGVNTFNFEDANLVSGVYTVSLTAPGGITQTQRLVVLSVP